MSAKAKSKYEIYLLLCIEAKIYLPKVDHVTIYFLKDIIAGKRKGKLLKYYLHIFIGIKQDKIQTIFVPQYEALTVHCITNFLE